MAVNLSFIGGAGWQFFDDNGDPLSGGKIYTYAAGTTTPQTTYTSRDGTIPNANPIILDAAGRTPQQIWSTEGLLYKYVVKTSADVLVRSWDNIGGTVVANDLAEDLANTTNNNKGDALIGFRQSNASGFLTGAVGRTVNAKLQEIVSVKDFGAVGDGVADDTTAVHAAFNAASAVGGTAYFPPGVYRVTSGYTHSGTKLALHICGDGRGNNNDFVPGATTAGSVIRFDNADVNSFFFDENVLYGDLTVTGMNFECAQSVSNRMFFKFTNKNIHNFANVAFFSVEKPINYLMGSYFQSSSFTNVSFNNSGTIHSSTGGGVDNDIYLRGTLLVINNVNHEGSVPVNTDKIVCDLSGIREIQATNFLLEGALPATGWTALRIFNNFDGAYTNTFCAQFNGFWTEWATNDPTYSVHQSRGRVVFNGASALSAVAVAKYKLDNYAIVDIKDAAYLGDFTAPVDTQFEFQDLNCKVNFINCSARYWGTTLIDPHYSFVNCKDASINPVSSWNTFSSTDAQIFPIFEGGYLDPGKVLVGGAGSIASQYPSVDATYARKYVITPAAGGSLTLSLNAYLRGSTAQGQKYSIVTRFKFPTFTGGTYRLDPVDGAGASLGGYFFDSTYSNQVVTRVFPLAVPTGGDATLGLQFSVLSAISGFSGVFEIYYLAIHSGEGVIQTVNSSFPNNIITYNTAAPTAGEWKRGDRVLNSSPSVGAPKGWICTVSGTPGTWVSEGNL